MIDLVNLRPAEQTQKRKEKFFPDDRRVIDMTMRVVPENEGNPWITISTSLKARGETRILLIAFSSPRDQPNRPCTTASRQVQALTFFSSFLRLLSFFFLSRVHRFRAALQAQQTAERQNRTSLGRVLTGPIESVIKMGPRCADASPDIGRII